MNNIAPVDAKMKEQERAKQMELATRRREELEMQMQIETAMGRKARRHEMIADARMAAEELHTHIMNCRLLKQTEDALT